MKFDTDFKDKFYNLKGVHYNERKKNFAKLLKATDPEDLSQHLDIKPRNYLERIFYVDILIHAKQVDKLVEVLKEGNRVLISKILKQKWFFKEAFKNLSEAAIVNEFLPTLSYPSKMKVLKKMSLTFDEQRMDNVFDYVVQRYGIFVGQQFLFSCSSSKIIDILKNNQVTLTVEQLKRILDKDYNLVKIYLDEYQKNTGQPFDNCNFLSYIPWKYPNLYFEFQPYYRDFVKIGRQTTKTVLKINTSDALKDVDKFQRKFNISFLARNVIDFDKNYLSKNFPVKIRRVERDTDWRIIANFLRKYPQKKRWQVFSRTFTQAYNEDPINHLETISEDVVEMFPSGIKEKWGEIQFRKTNYSFYIQYFDAKKAFALVKKNMNITSEIDERKWMLAFLIKSCHTNKDYNTYEEVLKYIVSRHRNDDNSLRNQVMIEISENIDYELSTETFWNYVKQLIDIFRVKGEDLPLNNIGQYLIFAVKRNFPLDELVAQYVKDADWCFWNFGEEREVQRLVMRHSMKLLHMIEEESRRETRTIDLMETIVKFNSYYPEFSIDLNECPSIVELVKKILAKDQISTMSEYTCIKHLVKNNYEEKNEKPLKVCEESKLLDIIKTFYAKKDELDFEFSHVIMQPRTTEFQHGLLDLYFTRYVSRRSQYSRYYILKYFMTNEPQVIVKYSDQIFSIEVQRPELNYSLVKLYSHLALDEKLVAYFRPLVQVSSTCETKTKLFDILSEIMPTDDFICLVQEYIPKKTEDSEQRKLYEAQCAIAKSFTNLDEYIKLIPLLGPFCQGDYLQSSLPLLYKVMYNVNEQQASSFIKVLTQRAVSARKHAVYLGFEVLPQKDSGDVFNIVATKETEVSAKKYLFRAVLKYFLKNPSEILMETVLKNITFVHKYDQESLHDVVNSINKVPINLRPVFVDQLWNFLDVIETQEIKVLQYRTTLLSTINSYEVRFFSAVKESFCQNVIINHFFSNEDFMLRNGKAYDFAAKYLLAHTDEEHFKFLFDILQNYKNLHWKPNKSHKLAFIFQFFKQVYKKYIRQDTQFLKLFKIYWEQVFTLEESLNEYVLLRVMVLYKETANISEFSKGVGKSFEEITHEYVPYINDILVDCVRTFFSIDDLENDPLYTKINFVLGLLDSKSEINCLVAAKLAVAYGNEDDNDKYFEIINDLGTANSVAVRIHCNDLLKR